MNWNPYNLPPLRPRPPPEIDPFTQGVMLSELATRTENIDTHLAGLRQDIRSLPADIALHLRAAGFFPKEEETMLKRVTRFLNVLFPYAALVAVVLAKLEMPDLFPILRTAFRVFGG